MKKMERDASTATIAMLLKHVRNSTDGDSVASVVRSKDIRVEKLPLRRRIAKFLRTNLLLVLTAAGIVVGFAAGLVTRKYEPSKDTLIWLGLPGDLFLRLLKMMILPLIVSCVISGTASLDARSNGKISLLSVIYIIATNVLACLVGIVFALAIKPGVGVTEIAAGGGDKTRDILQTQDIFADLVRNIVPDNVVGACIEKTQTIYVKEKAVVILNTSDGYANTTKEVLHKTIGAARGTNLIGIIFACLVFGMATRAAGEKGKPFLMFFQSTADIVIKIMRWFLWYTPIGVASLIAAALASITDLEKTFSQLGMFILTVTVGLLLHQVVLLQLIHFVLTRENPYSFYAKLLRPWLTGFAATSTAVAIPDMYRSCDSKKIDKRVSRFVIPFCVTLNADGSAIFISAAAMFIAQMSSINLDPGQICVIGILTAVSTLALPSVPSSSIVTLVIILSSIGIPTRDIAILFTVEWFLDRVRTTGNIVSHCFCAAFTDYYCKKDLALLDELAKSRPDVDDVESSVSGSNDSVTGAKNVTFCITDEDKDEEDQAYESLTHITNSAETIID
ncbi:excitatory amino acid transporter-like [Tubulanus polymorphus]|uniref:excitatory amino acid transporter-like n=1 Tax=Tubulanus polymorphus TaxID=672921 RepID=UPI003DA266E7